METSASVSTPVKVALVGFGIPNSNKNGSEPITLEDLKTVKAKAEKVVEVKEPKLEYDFYWNAGRGIFIIKKKHVDANPTDQHGYTFFLTETNQLLLLQSTSANPMVAFRPKFLKGKRATPSFKSEYGEFLARTYFDKLNATVEDGEPYLMSENRYFTMTPVEVEAVDTTAFLLTDTAWAAKQPKEVPTPQPVEETEAVGAVSEASPVSETEGTNTYGTEASIVEEGIVDVEETPASVAEAEIAEADGTAINLDWRSVGESAK